MFDEYLAPLDGLAENARQTLTQMEQASPLPAERTDVTLQSRSTTVSDQVLWKPWTWGRSHKEFSVQEISRSYWEVEDTLTFLQEFAREFALLWDGLYAPMTDTARLHNQLLLYARDTLTQLDGPTPDETVQALVRRALTHLYPPRTTLGTEALRARLRSRFPAKACDPTAREALEAGCREAVQEAVAAARQELEEGLRRFTRTVRAAQEDFFTRLSAPAAAQRQQIEASLADLRREAARCQEFVETARRLS